MKSYQSTYQLTEEALQEFIELWQRKHPGETPDPVALQEEAQRSFNGVGSVYRPIPTAKAHLLEELD